MAAGSDLGAGTAAKWGSASETTEFLAGAACDPPDPTMGPTGVPTATPSPSLSLPPTRPPVDCGDQTHLLLELKTHIRPFAFRWEIFDECSGEVAEWRGGGGGGFRRWFEDGPNYSSWYTEPHHTYHEDICLPHSMYQFKIKEKTLNNVLIPAQGYTALQWEELGKIPTVLPSSCLAPLTTSRVLAVIGRGHYKLSQDGAVVAHGNSMGGAWRGVIESTGFGTDTCPQSPTESPTMVPTQAPFAHSTICPGTEIGRFSHFTLAFRARSMKSRWKLYDDHTGEVLASKGWSLFDLYWDDLRPYHHDFCLPPSRVRRYKFIIEGDDFLGYEHGSEYGVYSLKENGIPVLTGMRTGPVPGPVPSGGALAFRVTKHEETVFGWYDEVWDPMPPPVYSDADLSHGSTPPCHRWAPIVGAMSCNLFR